MFNLIKKDFLTISRDRSELLTLLAMPLILIIILGFALGGLMDGEEGIAKFPIALVSENDLEKDIESMSDESLKQIFLAAEEADPVRILIDVLESPELEELIELGRDYTLEEAEDALYNNEIAGIISLPEKFSYNTLSAILLGEEPQASINLLVANEEEFHAGIIESILTSYIDQYNLQVSIQEASGARPVESDIGHGYGEIRNLDSLKSVSSFQYYTMGMAVMFALYVSSTISSNAFKEKYTHVLGRLMLADERPLRYLLSKGISASVLSLVQLTILFFVSSIAFQTFSGMSSESLFGMGLVSLAFSLTIGSLASLLTAIALQFNTDSVSGIFSGVIVSGFAFVGGSMLPVGQISRLLENFGNWTPNGAMMTAYLQLIQGFSLSDVLPMIYRVMIMMVVFIILALAIFPKRRLI